LYIVTSCMFCLKTCISRVEEKFKFPLVCTMWCQFWMVRITALSCKRAEVFETEIWQKPVRFFRNILHRLIF